MPVNIFPLVVFDFGASRISIRYSDVNLETTFFEFLFYIIMSPFCNFCGDLSFLAEFKYQHKILYKTIHLLFMR